MNLSILKYHGLLFSIFLATTSPLIMTPTLAMDRLPEEDHEQLPPLPKSLKEDFDREQSAKKAYNSLCKSGRRSKQQGLNELYNSIIKHGASSYSVPSAFYIKKALLEGKVTIKELDKKDKRLPAMVHNLCHNFIDIKLFGSQENPMGTLEAFFAQSPKKPPILTSYKDIQKAHPHLTQKDILSTLARGNPSNVSWASLAYASDTPESLILLCKSLRLNLQSRPDPELKDQFDYYAKLYTLKNPMLDTEDKETNEIISEGLYLRSCDINTSNQGAAALCRKAADRDHTEAQYSFGCRLLDGDGVKIDEPLGIQYLKKAADKNHEKALFSYAYTCYKDKKMPEALDYFLRAADHTHPGAYFYLGEMYSTGNGVPEDKKIACDYFKLAADRGHSEARMRCGQIFSDQNPETSFRYYHLAAMQNHRKAQLICGDILYRRGKILEAFDYYKLAAARDDLSALNMCGCILFNNEKYTEAFAYYNLAAKLGHAIAQRMCGYMLNEGKGMPVNRQQAFHYYKLAADQGNIDAQYMCGTFLLNGDDVPQDIQQAFHYYKLAADKGYPKAQRMCGSILDAFFCKEGSSSNSKKAFDYYKLAADQGDLEAQLICATKCYNGTGVIEDKPRAFYYYNLAAAANHKQALHKCGLMLSKGDGVERNNNKALNYLQQALELEDLSIMFPIELELQKNYCSLLSVADEDDKIAAHQRLKNLVLQGSYRLRYVYAHLCQHGIGAPQDYDEALKYYELLAKDRHGPAQLGCAQIFHAKKDLDKAFEYCQMAAQQDYLEALSYLPVLENERSGKLTESAEVEFFPLNAEKVLEDNTSSSDEGDTTEEPLSDAQATSENKEVEKLTLSGDLALSDELLKCKNINMKQNLEFRAKKKAQKEEKKRRQEEAAQQTRITLKLNNGQSKNLANPGGARIRLKRKVSYRAMQFIKAIYGQGVKINTFSNEEARKIFAELGCGVANKKGKNTTILSFKPTIVSFILENGQEIEMEYQAQTTEDTECREQKTQYHNPHGHGDNNLYQALQPHLKRYFMAIDITPDTVQVE